MIVKDLRPTGRQMSLALARGDPVLMVQSILSWLCSRLVSGAVCACVSACLLLHYCPVCQVRNGKQQMQRHILSSVFVDAMLLQKDDTRVDYIQCG